MGRTKEKHTLEGILRYRDKLKPFMNLEVVEIKEQKGTPVKKALVMEAERILKQTTDFMLFDEGGQEMSSTEFALFLRDRAQAEFVIGGPYGVADAVKDAATKRISLSRMTFTHDMARLFVLEQLYRAVMINSGKGYHH